MYIYILENSHGIVTLFFRRHTSLFHEDSNLEAFFEALLHGRILRGGHLHQLKGHHGHQIGMEVHGPHTTPPRAPRRVVEMREAVAPSAAS